MDLIEVDCGEIGPVDFGLSQTKKLWLLEQGWKSIDKRLRECSNNDGGNDGNGHSHSNDSSVSELPAWLLELKVKAEQEAADVANGVSKNGGGNAVGEWKEEIKGHFANVQASLGELADEVKQCVAEGNDVSFCAKQLGVRFHCVALHRAHLPALSKWFPFTYATLCDARKYGTYHDLHTALLLRLFACGIAWTKF